MLLFAYFEVLAKGIQGNKIESIGGAKAAKACCRWGSDILVSKAGKACRKAFSREICRL